MGAKDGEEFATINHLPNILLKRQVFIAQALLHGGGAASGCALLAPLRDFQAEAVADVIASLLTLCTIRISLKMQLKVQFRTQFRIP